MISGKRIWGVIGISLVLAGCGPDIDEAEQFEAHVSRAQQFVENGDEDAAIIELKNALQFQPENTELRAKLGALYLDTGDSASAEKELRLAHRARANPALYILNLADTYLRLREWDKVLELGAPDRRLSPQDQARFHAQRGSAYLGMEEKQLARDEFEKSLAIDAESVPAWLGQAALAIGEGKRASARLLVKQALPRAVGSDAVEVWRLTAELARLDGDLEVADQGYTKAIELSKENRLSIRLARADLRTEQGDFAGAKEDINSLPGRYANHPHVLYARGLLALREQRFADAKTYLASLKQADHEHIFGIFYLAIAHLALGELSDAEGYLTYATELAPRSLRIAMMLGQTRYRMGKFDDAAKVLEPWMARKPDDTELQSLLGSIYLAKGAVEYSSDLLASALKKRPELSAIRLKYGLSLMASGDSEQALVELKQAVEDSGGSEKAQITLLMGYLTSGDIESARELVTQMMADSPDNPHHWNLLASVELAYGKIDAAREAYAKALELKPDLASAAYNLARLEVETGNRELGRDLYDKLLAKHPNHLHALMAVAQLEERAANTDAAAEYMTRAMKAHPSQLGPRLWLARRYSNEENKGEALKLLAEVREFHSGNPAYLSVLGEAQLRADKASDGVDTFLALTRLVPKDAAVHYSHARACAMASNFDCLRTALVNALQLDDAYPGMPHLVHHAITLSGEDAVTRKLLWRLQNASPGNLFLTQLRGQFAMRSDRYGEAIAIYEQALQDASGDWGLRESLARAHAASGDFKSAFAVIDAWRARYPKDTADVVLLEGKVLFQSGNEEAAISAFEKVLRIEPESVQALNNLAWLLRKRDLARAIDYANRAFALSPNYQTRDTLGIVLMEKGELDRAEALLRSAFGEQPQSQSIRFHFAQVLEKLGKNIEAKALLEELLADETGFEGREAAQTLFRSLGG